MHLRRYRSLLKQLCIRPSGDYARGNGTHRRAAGSQGSAMRAACLDKPCLKLMYQQLGSRRAGVRLGYKTSNRIQSARRAVRWLG